MAKIERKYMAHYIDAALPSASKGSPNYVRLGKDLEEYSPELSANVEKMCIRDSHGKRQILHAAGTTQPGRSGPAGD